MDFGEILSKAWKTIWKNKILWLFGILAGCGGAYSTQGGGGGGSSSGIQMPSSPGPSPFNTPLDRNIDKFAQFLADIPVWVWIAIGIAFIILIFVLSIIFLMLGTLGQTGVIKGASLADQAKEEDKPLSLKDIFKGIKPHYWKILLFNVGFRISWFILNLLLIIPIVILTICTCCLGLLLLVPVGWFVQVMIYFTTIAIIEEDLDIFKAIARAWEVLTKNLGNVVLMFLILGLGQLILGFIIVLPIFLTPIPILINLAVTGFESATVGLIISAILFLIILPIVIFLSGVLMAYVLSAWTLTYRRLTGENSLTPIVITDGQTETDEPEADENEEAEEETED